MVTERGNPPTPGELDVVARQLGRPVRGVVAVSHRCGCGHPDVVMTNPSLPDGTPFPTLYYLTCPRVCAAIGTLEAEGLMKQFTAELAADSALAERYLAAHEQYLSEREALAVVPQIAGVSAGGMPTRVKCLHVLVAHSLAAGPGVNPLGDWTVQLLADRGIAADSGWGAPGSCVNLCAEQVFAGETAPEGVGP